MLKFDEVVNWEVKDMCFWLDAVSVPLRYLCILLFFRFPCVRRICIRVTYLYSYFVDLHSGS